MKKYNFGISGVGYWGNRLVEYFSEAADDLDIDLRFTHFVAESKTKKNRKIYRTCPGIVQCDFKEMTKMGLDAIVIACPIGNLAKQSFDALQEKNNVFLEKPGRAAPYHNVNYYELKYQNEIAKSNNKIFQVGYKFFYNFNYQDLKSRFEPRSMTNYKFVWNKFGSFHNDIANNILCHDLALALDLFDFDHVFTEVVSKTHNKLHYQIIDKERQITVDFFIDRSVSNINEHKHVFYKNDMEILNLSDGSAYGECKDFLQRLETKEDSEHLPRIEILDRVSDMIKYI